MSNIQLLPSVPNPGYYNTCSGALSVIVPQESINLITSPSFELFASATFPALTNWEIELHTGATVNPVTSYIVTGTKSYAGASSLYSRTISGNHVKSITYATLPVTTGYYAWSFYIYGDVRSNGRLYTSTIRDSSTSAILASKQFVLIENQWNRIELIWYSTSSLSVSVGIEKDTVSGLFAGGDCWIDACQFEKLQVQNITGSTDGLRATTYFDGSTTGFIGTNTSVPEYSWSGTIHRSQSKRSGQSNHGGRVINLQDNCALEIISINEAGINQPTNHDGVFNTADGGQLIDIINSKRTITMIGRVSGTDKNDFVQKIAQLTAYFSRDVSPIRTPRRFIFQHKDGRDNIGVELTFFAAFESGLNVTLSDVYVANVEISLTMYDPYFYGHDESIDLSLQNYLIPGPVSGNRALVGSVSPYVTEMTDRSLNLIWKLIGPTGNLRLNARVNALALDNDGMLWIGGDFTQENTSGSTYNRIVMYDPTTQQLLPVVSGVTNGVNGIVYDIQVDPAGRVWVAGAFTSAGGVAGTAYIAYYDKSLNTFVAISGALNNTVYSIAISKKNYFPTTNLYEVVIGGAFTTVGGVTFNRLARLDITTGNWQSVGVPAGANNVVYKVIWASQASVSNRYYLVGAFTQLAGATADRIGYIQGSTLDDIGYGFTSADNPFDLLEDSDGNIVVRLPGDSGSTITNYSTGQVTSNIDDYNDLAYFNGQRLSWWQESSGKYMRPQLGFTQGTQSMVLSNGNIYIAGKGYYWPGSATAPITFTRYNHQNHYDQDLYVLHAAPDGTIWYGSSGVSLGSTGDVAIAVIQYGYNSSTVASKPTLSCITETGTSIESIKNWQNNAIIDFLPFVINTNDRRFTTTKYELFEFNFQTLSFKTNLQPNVLGLINPPSAIATFDIMPGNVYMSILDRSQSDSVSPTISTTTKYALHWKQTFQSIFDGINKL